MAAPKTKKKVDGMTAVNVRLSDESMQHLARVAEEIQPPGPTHGRTGNAIRLALSIAAKSLDEKGRAS